jgi:hypothetical protein
VIPPFERGVLPAGVHKASWREVTTRFGTNAHRRWLLEGLYSALTNLRAAGCVKVWVDGSFVTDKAQPGDFDICWDTAGVDPTILDPVLLEVDPPRFAQRVKYRGDILPNPSGPTGMYTFVDFFQINKLTGDPKGIVEVDLRTINQ